VFSDKTGTLTCNVMDFRKASINGISYGLGITEIGKASWKLQGKAIPDDILDGEEKAKACSVPHVSFYDPLFEEHRQRSDLQSQRIQEFFRILALCHDTIPERIDGKIKLSASNPDDECLVVAAKYFGAEFLDRRESFAIFQSQGRTQEVEVLEILGFTSKRKRMSVVIRDVDGVIRVLTKGADSVMAPRLAAGQATLFSTSSLYLQIVPSHRTKDCLLYSRRGCPGLRLQPVIVETIVFAGLCGALPRLSSPQNSHHACESSHSLKFQSQQPGEGGREILEGFSIASPLIRQHDPTNRICISLSLFARSPNLYEG
jgi:magnesium-transporting ATPase (P-type)